MGEDEPSGLVEESLAEAGLVFGDVRTLDRDRFRQPAVTSGVVVGVGTVGGVGEDELSGLVEETLAEAGLAFGDVRALATLDRRATEPAIVQLARQHGWELLIFSAEVLAVVEVPSPSAGVRAVTGTPSVAEAAALAGAGTAELIVAKRRSAGATAAVAKVCGTF